MMVRLSSISKQRLPPLATSALLRGRTRTTTLMLSPFPREEALVDDCENGVVSIYFKFIIILLRQAGSSYKSSPSSLGR